MLFSGVLRQAQGYVQASNHSLQRDYIFQSILSNGGKHRGSSTLNVWEGDAAVCSHGASRGLHGVAKALRVVYIPHFGY